VHVLRIHKNIILKKILNLEIQGKFPKRRPEPKWEQQSRKDVRQEERFSCYEILVYI
jgi:hypothetical protein